MKIDIADIKKIAQTAGEEILKFYNSDYDVSYKTADKSSPLTEADLAANKIILDGLEKYGWPILSEESTDNKVRLDSEYVWIVDPLDGTSDFVGKTDEFCVMIGLIKDKEAVLGVVYEPMKATFYFAEKGKGAFQEKNGQVESLIVSNQREFSRMKILLSRNHLMEEEVRLSEKLNFEKKTCGSAGLKICKIAAGEGDVYINTSDKMNEWDTCAPYIILKEAKGGITDMSGNELLFNKEIPNNPNGVVVTNGIRHNDIIEELKNITQ